MQSPFRAQFVYTGLLAAGNTFGYYVDPNVSYVTSLSAAIQEPSDGDIVLSLVDQAGNAIGEPLTIVAGAYVAYHSFANQLSIASSTPIRAKVISTGSESGQGLTFTAIGVVSGVSTDTPVIANLCRVYGYVMVGGNPAFLVQVEAQLQNPPRRYGDLVFDTDVNETRTDQAGYWSLDLIQGQEYLFTILETGIVKLPVTIPVQTQYSFSEFLS